MTKKERELLKLMLMFTRITSDSIFYYLEELAVLFVQNKLHLSNFFTPQSSTYAAVKAHQGKKTNFMIYLLLLRFDDVLFGVRHSPTTRLTCSVMCNFCHDDVFIVKCDDGEIMFAVCDCLLVVSISIRNVELQKRSV